MDYFLFYIGVYLIALAILMLVLIFNAVRRIEQKLDLAMMPPRIIPFPDSNYKTAAALMLSIAIASTAAAQDPVPKLQQMHIGDGTRPKYFNTDGSCVQCSLGMCGCNCNDLNAAYLLWDSEFGPAERGGSNPSRVEAYCNRRGIVAYSVTGHTPDDTLPFIRWAAMTGRFAAVGAGTQHFQTLWGYDPATNEYLLCNNQTPLKIERYSEKRFRELHAASGPWVVVLEKSSSPPPQYFDWRK